MPVTNNNIATAHQPLTAGLLLCAFTGTLTAFQFGYNAGVINQPRDAMSNCTKVTYPIDKPNGLPECIPMDDWQWGLFVSIFLLGGIIGGLSGGHLATTLGRRRLLVYNNITFLLASYLLYTSTSVTVLCAGRLVAGVGAGVGTVVVPLYLNEIAPKAVKGTFGSLNQLMIVIGVLVSQVVGIGLSTRVGYGWRVLLALTSIPSLVQIALIPFCVETPSWLASNGLNSDAKKSLQYLRGGSIDSVNGELGDIVSAAGGRGASSRGPSDLERADSSVEVA
ncbi:Solute carrier 2, facilitated glucose transporter member 1, partial [Blyttiomyces sp. JEL0837]